MHVPLLMLEFLWSLSLLTLRINVIKCGKHVLRYLLDIPIAAPYSVELHALLKFCSLLVLRESPSSGT